MQGGGQKPAKFLLSLFIITRAKAYCQRLRLHARHHATCFACWISFDFQNHPVREVLFLSPSFKMRKWRPRQSANNLIGVSVKAGLAPCPCLIAEYVPITHCASCGFRWVSNATCETNVVIPCYPWKCSPLDVCVSGPALKVVAFGWAHTEGSTILREFSGKNENPIVPQEKKKSISLSLATCHPREITFVTRKQCRLRHGLVSLHSVKWLIFFVLT